MEPLPDRNLVTVAHYQTMEWATLQFAPLALRAGRTRFHLRAASKPGPDVASIKALIAERR